MKKNILLIGVGGTGSNAVDIFFKKYNELGNQTENKITALVFDTDAGDLKKITEAKTVRMADTASVGTICDRVGKQYLREWFPCDTSDVRAQEMVRGASQWRKKSFLAFLNLMNKPLERRTFLDALEEMIQDPGASCEVYVIASVAGGTGSGSFIPIALYAKRYLRKNLGKDPIVNAMIALPDIYADHQTPENRVKVYSNAYAILRELNAINLVSRNYNASMRAKKNAPVCFRIGHPEEPNVGVLFDASDKSYWTPEAAPFTQVFLLDRIPGLKSIAAHDMVLANSLYTILCTEIGAAFDSEFSNHALVRSQNNGSNAIYAGISTSQIKFPKDSVLDYLAYKKTLLSCDSEWLTLHKAVENAVSAKEREAKAARRRFVMENDEYADLVLKTMENKISENSDDIINIVDRCVTIYDKDGKSTDNTAGKRFVELIDQYIQSRIPGGDIFKDKGEDKDENVQLLIDDAINMGRGKSKEKKDRFARIGEDLNQYIFNYFKECYEAVKCAPISISDAVVTLDKKKIGTIGDQYAIAQNLLMNDEGKYVHPVAALIRLCQFRKEISEKISQRIEDWPELKRRSVVDVPERFCSDLEESSFGNSAYANLGADRFLTLLKSPEEYLKASNRSNIKNDVEQLKSDVNTILIGIHASTESLIVYKVYNTIARDVDLLIAKYRSFFNRFTKEKVILEEQSKDAKRKDAGTIDSAINVFSSEKDKDAIGAMLEEGNGPETEADVRETDNIVGQGVYSAVLDAAVAERTEDVNYNPNDASAYYTLFGKMVKAYRESIAKSEVYRNIASYNVIEAMVASCGENPSDKAMVEVLHSAFSVAQELAVPSLRLENDMTECDLVKPSEIMVFMLSVNTARYIKRCADKLGIHVPSDQSNAGAILKACAEEFVQKYSGNSGARVALVESIPDQVLYCTGEIMDITPLCIAKFNELGTDNIYFKNYNEALYRLRTYDTDMWNPHIGNDLHKRGYLPYMNPEMESACDEKMVKALLYGFTSGAIKYTNQVGATKYGKKYYFFCDAKRIEDSKKLPIESKNLAQLLSWMRNENDRIEKWSVAFDADIQKQLLTLPAIIGDDEIGTLEGAITKTPFMKMLNEMLYCDEAGRKISAVEFACLIKNNEELARDCDDAERILKVLYKVFCQFIGYRINIEQNPERYVLVYCQQLGNFYLSLAETWFMANRTDNREGIFNQTVTWMNDNELFCTVFDPNNFYDENGKVAFSKSFDYTKAEDTVKSAITSALHRQKKAKTAAGESDEPEEEDGMKKKADKKDKSEKKSKRDKSKE